MAKSPYNLIPLAEDVVKIEFVSTLVYPENYFLKDLLKHIENNNAIKIIYLDFKECDFVDSSSIGIFIGFIRRVRPRKLKVFFQNASNYIQEIFQVVNLSFLNEDNTP